MGTFRESAISYLPEGSANRPWSHVGFTQNVIHKEEFRAPLSLHRRPLLIRICYFLFKHVREVAVLLWLTSLPETRKQSPVCCGEFLLLAAALSGRCCLCNLYLLSHFSLPFSPRDLLCRAVDQSDMPLLCRP